jgi:hypothetical protein
MNTASAARHGATPPSGPVVPYNAAQAQAQHLRHPPPQAAYGPMPAQQQMQQLQPQAPPPQIQSSWFPPNMAAPQASHPALPPPAAAPVHHPSPPAQHEEWDDTYLAVLSSQDARQLRELLARSNPEIIMPMKSAPPLSQAVILTLVHRVSTLFINAIPRVY